MKMDFSEIDVNVSLWHGHSECTYLHQDESGLMGMFRDTFLVRFSQSYSHFFHIWAKLWKNALSRTHSIEEYFRNSYVCI